MSTELAKRLEFTDEQQQMILKTYAPGASPAEFGVLMETAKVRNLNPLTKQIYFVKMAGRWSFQVSIDGFRAIAQRSGLYAGQDAPVYEYDEKGQLRSCSVAVYRKDWNRPCVGVAIFKEFSTGQNLWASKPHVMLSKVAESIALRKAFSEETSGLYGEGELDQSITVQPAPLATQLEASKQVTETNPFKTDPEFNDDSPEQKAHLAEDFFKTYKFKSGSARGQFAESQPLSFLIQTRDYYQKAIDEGRETLPNLMARNAMNYWIERKEKENAADDFSLAEVEAGRAEVSE